MKNFNFIQMKKSYIINMRNIVKSYTIRVLLLIAIVMLGSCGDDFLEKAPTTSLSSATLWTSPSDADLALTGVYSTLRSTPLGSSRLIMLDALTDNGWSQYNSDDGRIQEIATGILTPLTGGIVSEMWNQNYTAIAHCNIFLSNIDKVPMPDATKEQYKAEVKFIRAQYYFMLTQFFGDVPLVLEPLTVETMYKARDPYDVVLKAIYEDLDEAVRVLPDVLYNGHAVKASALALKARILLFNGEFANAAATARQIIDKGIYSIWNNDEHSYLKLFSADGEQIDNPEILFSVRFLRPNVSNDILVHIGRSTAMSPLTNFMEDFEDGDLRKKLILMDGVENTWWPYGEALGTPSFASNLWESPTGYGVRKWSYMTCDLNNSNHDAHIPLMRYAEVLLNYAEAQNEASGPDQSVYDAINAIRERAQLEPLSGLTKEALREAIRHERRMELCYEGLRWMDLKRWKLAGEIIPQIPSMYNDPDGVKRMWKDIYYYWPIHQAELDKDREHLKQTPGYE
jgi:hypothetical protein